MSIRVALERGQKSDSALDRQYAVRMAQIFLPAGCMLFLAMWKISGPSYWRDEAATLSAVRRPFPVMLHMLGKTDVVHSVYYLLMWPLVHLLGPGEVVVRMPSALAAAVAAGGVAAIGRRVASGSVGLLSGLVFAVLPVTSRYGQEARSYALVMALGVLATYMFVRAKGTESAARRWYAAYSVILAVAAWLHLMTLALPVAHCVTGAARGRRWRVAGPLVAAIAAAVLAVTPLVVLAWPQQHGTERFLGLTNLRTLGDILMRLTGSWLTLIAVIPLLVIAVIAPRQYPDLNRLCLPWLLIPPLILVLTGAFYPVYDSRYILYCVPPVSILAGLGIENTVAWVSKRLSTDAAAQKRGLAFAAIAAVAIIGIPSQIADRSAGGHGDNIRLAAQIVVRNERPGDAVLYQPRWWRQVAAAYPYGFSRLHDVSLRRTPAEADDFTGTQFSIPVVRRRLAHVARVWLVEYLVFRPSPDLGPAWTMIRRWQAGTLVLTLYQSPAAGPAPDRQGTGSGVQGQCRPCRGAVHSAVKANSAS